MRKREFETERGTLRYWMSEDDEETAQLVFPIIQTGRVHGARGLSSAPAAICEAVCLRGEAWPRYCGEALHL